METKDETKIMARLLRVFRKNLLVLLTVVGVVVGLAVGFGIRETIPSQDAILWIGLSGEVYMRMLKMMILPLIISTVITGTASLNPRSQGRVSIVSIGYIAASNTLPSIIGALMVLMLNPGADTQRATGPSTGAGSHNVMQTQDIFADVIRNLFPDNLITAAFQQTITKYEVKKSNQIVNNSNVSTTEIQKYVGKTNGTNVLGLIICCTLFGVATSSVGKHGKPFLKFFQSASEIILRILQWLIWFTPVGVASLIATVLAQTIALEDTFKCLGMFILASMLGLVIFILHVDRYRREKEMELLKHQKEREIFEKQFAEGIYLAKITQRQAPIGTDRNHSRYWVFSDVTPGLFVEKGWISDVIDYSVKPADAVDSDHSSSSSDDDSGGEEAEGAPTNKKNKVAKVKKCVDTTFPRVSQNLWFTYDSMKDVDNLIESLHERGSRESVLKTELKKRYSDISSAIYKFKRSNKELRDCDGDKEMFEAFKKELLETEMRLRHGGLGGVMDFSSWEARLQTAPNIGPLAECLLEVQEHVLDKFRDGIFAQKPKKKPEVKEEDKESDDEDDEPLMAPGIISWRDAVKTCATYSRLHVLLGILDSCIKWEKSSENAKCKICRKKGEEDRMLLCDDCNQAFHMFCLRPALLDVPTGDWHCPACAPQYRKRVQNIPGRYKEYSQNDSDTEDFGKSSRRKEKTIVHEENCVECGGDEDLISCVECPSVYHLECHDPPLRHPPRGRWVCNDCKNGITRKTRRGSQRAARKVNRAAAKRKRKEESEDEEESDDESPKRERKPRKGKVKKKTESSDEEDEDSDEEDESEDEFEPPPKKAARTSKQQTVAKRGRKSKDSSSPKVGRPKGKRATQSPEVAYDTKPKASRRAPSDLSIAESIIDQMMKFKDAWPFYDLVLKKDVPDYYEIIKQPISFQKIKDRLNCLVYGSPQEVINAVALLFRNAAQYNKVDSDIWQLMEISEKHFIDLLGKHLPMYVYSRDQVNGDDDPMDTSDGRKSRRSK